LLCVANCAASTTGFSRLLIGPLEDIALLKLRDDLYRLRLHDLDHACNHQHRCLVSLRIPKAPKIRFLFHSEAVRLPQDADLQSIACARLDPVSYDPSRQR
jgi:hypothetical protein